MYISWLILGLCDVVISTSHNYMVFVFVCCIWVLTGWGMRSCRMKGLWCLRVCGVEMKGF